MLMILPEEKQVFWWPLNRLDKVAGDIHRQRLLNFLKLLGLPNAVQNLHALVVLLAVVRIDLEIWFESQEDWSQSGQTGFPVALEFLQICLHAFTELRQDIHVGQYCLHLEFRQFACLFEWLFDLVDDELQIPVVILFCFDPLLEHIESVSTVLGSLPPDVDAPLDLHECYGWQWSLADSEPIDNHRLQLRNRLDGLFPDSVH